MKKLLLISGLLLGTMFSANAQVTVTVPSSTFAGGFFATAYNGGELVGTLTSIDVNVTLSASAADTYASDFSILVTDGLTATSNIMLQAGGFSDFGFAEHNEWGTGDSDVAGTVCSASYTLVTPIDFSFDPTLKVYYGNGYSGTGSSGTWSGTFTLNGLTLAPLSVNENDMAADFSVYPNPANSVINVANKKSNITGVTMTDLNGRTVKQVSFDNLATAQVNIADLSAGMYMMTIKSAEGQATKKIVKN